MEELNKLTLIILGIVVLGVIVGAGFMVIDQEATTVNQATANGFTSTNETSGTISNTSAIAISTNTTKPGFILTAVGDVYNTTNGIYINPGNYTWTKDGGIISTDTSCLKKFGCGATWKITYTYSTSTSAAYNATNQVSTAMNQIPTWTPILILVFIAGIIIFLIVRWQGESRGG